MLLVFTPPCRFLPVGPWANVRTRAIDGTRPAALEDETKWRNDPVLSIIGERQYVDWREMRHYSDVDRTAVYEQIARLCEKIVEALHEPWPSPEERRATKGADARLQVEREPRQRDAEEERGRLRAAAKRSADQEVSWKRVKTAVQHSELIERPKSWPSWQRFALLCILFGAPVWIAVSSNWPDLAERFHKYVVAIIVEQQEKSVPRPKPLAQSEQQQLGQPEQKPSAQPAVQPEQKPSAQPPLQYVFGLKVADLTDQLREQYSIIHTMKGPLLFGIGGDLPWTTKRELPGDKAELAPRYFQPGSVIVKVEERLVANVAELTQRMQVLKEGRSSAKLAVFNPDGQVSYLYIDFGWTYDSPNRKP